MGLSKDPKQRKAEEFKMAKSKTKNKFKQPRRPDRMERVETYGNIELRFKNGELDDMAMVDESGKVIFRMEWMHDNEYWMGLYGTKKDINIYFDSEAKIKFKIVK